MSLLDFGRRFETHPIRWLVGMWLCVLYAYFMMAFVMSTRNPVGEVLALSSQCSLVFAVYVTVLMIVALSRARRRCE